MTDLQQLIATSKEGKQTILIAEDIVPNYLILKNMLQAEGFQTIHAASGLEAIAKATDNMPDAIIMDVGMPQLDGIRATERLKQNILTKHIPIIILTGHDSEEERIQGIAMGANEYLTKPVRKAELKLRLNNLLEIKRYHDFLADYNMVLEDEVKARSEELQKTLNDLKNSNNKLKMSYIQTIQKLSVAAEFKDNETADHCKRVSLYTIEIAERIGMDKEFTERMYYTAPMHDVGKVGIPDRVLLKDGPLTTDEWVVMKGHTSIGYGILGDSDSDILLMAGEIALTHHERWDGNGYPQGLRGEQIPISGRIMNIADQYDALRSARPYKQGFSHQSAMDIILKGDGRTMPSHFDPEVLLAFEKAAKMFDEIFRTRIVEDEYSDKVLIF